jgi:hypothetical protein
MKISGTAGPMDGNTPDEADEWKYQIVEESATQSPIKKTMTYAMVKEHTYEEILNVMTGSDWWIEEPLGTDSGEA